MNKILFLTLLLASSFLAFAEDVSEIVYKGSAVEKSPPALSILVFNMTDVTGLDEKGLTTNDLQDLDPDESCQVSLHEHRDLLPPGTTLSPFDTLHPDLAVCNQEQIGRLKLIFLELGWIETQYAALPVKNIAARITSIVLSKTKRNFVGKLAITGLGVGSCLYEPFHFYLFPDIALITPSLKSSALSSAIGGTASLFSLGFLSGAYYYNASLYYGLTTMSAPIAISSAVVCSILF